MRVERTQVVIHVRQPLGAYSRTSLERAACAIPGVAGTRVHPRAGHLMLVDFDHARISVEELQARTQHLGYRTSYTRQ